ncbi:DUF2663 family protein [Pontibacillus marinus]|uniref:DUF2663 domain-containing protein n=1 Tax=Pontibacillus marinus BH030004 = DSM 16465 TaxID=1385511 RepID=A0A0A5I1H1_9BACI|nr:DUF2663 family protein [Pontibacillus marinus]KGX89707.1 hypothetical protein N783_04915 [Pontibacillus marinus BH030004 = DSM 16465]
MSVPIWNVEGFKENDRIMLDKLVERSIKKKKAETLHQGILTIFVILAAAFMAWLFQFGVQSSYTGDVLSLIFYHFSDTVNMTGYLVLALLYAYWRQLHKKFKKEKDKYENLRSEVIEKKDKYWSLEYSDDLLAKLVSELEGFHKINVSYKS